MSVDAKIWLDRWASLHKSEMRKAASAAGLQFVQLEILQYLSVCNRHSNTAKDLSDYLGQTKGSISQSLNLIEEAGHIERKSCTKDRRVTRLHLTSAGKKCVKQVSKDMLPEIPQDGSITESLKALLQNWQADFGVGGFGQCKSCKHNQVLDGGKFHCGLLDETLTKSDTLKICREYEV